MPSLSPGWMPRSMIAGATIEIICHRNAGGSSALHDGLKLCTRPMTWKPTRRIAPTASSPPL